tara:strand:+ start:134 stop:505 length:372 start_codon:yes stop_codon:yes gene_type:complete
MTTDGFISVVKLHAEKDKDTGSSVSGDDLMVRSRVKGHLESLFPGHDIVHTPHRDYAYRAFVSRYEVAEIVYEEVIDIQYDNFKNSVVADNNYSAGLAACWHEMYHALQVGAARDVSEDNRHA